MKKEERVDRAKQTKKTLNKHFAINRRENRREINLGLINHCYERKRWQHVNRGASKTPIRSEYLTTWLERDVRRKHLRRSSKIITTMIRTRISWWARKFRNSTTVSTRREALAKARSHAVPTIIASSTEKRSSSCSKKTVRWIPMAQIMQRHKRPRPNSPRDIFAPSAASHRITLARRAGRDSAASNASQHTKKHAAWSLFTKWRVFNWSIIDTTWGRVHWRSEKLAFKSSN